MDNSYIFLYRKLINSEVFANEKALKIWIWCLLKASYKERYIPFSVGKGQVTVKLNAGQFIYGRHKVDELNIDKEVVRYWLTKFDKNFKLIKIKPTNQYSIITICKWSTYQDIDSTELPTNHQPITNQLPSDHQPITNQLPSDHQVTTTNNKVKKVKKVKKVNKVEKESTPTPTVEKTQFLDFVFLKESEYQKLVEKHGTDDTNCMIEKLNNFKASTGKTYASDYHAINNWVVEWLKEEKIKKAGGGGGGGKNGTQTGQISPQTPPLKPDYTKISFY